MKTILIDIDSLRPDHLGCYDYSKNISPEIDSLAEDALVFEKAYTCASPSLPSRAAIISGRYPESNKVVTHGPQGQEMSSPYNWGYERKKEWDGDLRNWWNLSELLFYNDISCCAVSSFGRYPVPWLFRTWNDFIQPQSSMENGTHATVDGEDVCENALNWLSQNKADDFFLYVQFWDPHVPCMRKEEEINEIDDGLPDYLQKADFSHKEPRSADERGLEDMEDLRLMVQKYEAEVKHVDRQVGKILDFLKKEGIYEDTNIILTADHGEEFGEKGVFREHWSSFEGTQRVPLIMKLNGMDSRRVDKLVSNIDIAPTVAELHNLAPPEKWAGKSVITRFESSDWEKALLTMHGLYTVQRAVIGQRFKFLKTMHQGIRPENEKEQLFDLKEDPYEQIDISDQRKGLVKDFRKILEEMVDERIEKNDPVSKLADEGPYGWKWNRV